LIAFSTTKLDENPLLGAR